MAFAPVYGREELFVKSSGRRIFAAVWQPKEHKFYGFRYDVSRTMGTPSNPIGEYHGWGMAIGLPFLIISVRVGCK